MPVKCRYYSVIFVVLLFGALPAWANDGCAISEVISRRPTRAFEARPITRGEQIASYYRERALLERQCAYSTAHLSEAATPEQNSLFISWTGSYSHFYEQARLDSYVFNAKGKPPVEFAKLQNSAASLFDSQQRFIETLTSTQRVALRSQLHGIERLRVDSEKRLYRLANGKPSPVSGSYVKTVNMLKRDLEEWSIKQREIANRLGIQLHTK